MNNFQEVIKEDIKELLDENPCLYCNKPILFKNLGGFEHTKGNVLDLQKPICLPCWQEKELLEEDRFASLDDVLSQSEGSLTENVELISIEDRVEKDTFDEQFFKDGCRHEYKMVENNKVQCRHCYKKFSLVEN